MSKHTQQRDETGVRLYCDGVLVACSFDPDMRFYIPYCPVCKENKDATNERPTT